MADESLSRTDTTTSSASHEISYKKRVTYLDQEFMGLEKENKYGAKWFHITIAINCRMFSILTL